MSRYYDRDEYYYEDELQHNVRERVNRRIANRAHGSVERRNTRSQAGNQRALSVGARAQRARNTARTGVGRAVAGRVADRAHGSVARRNERRNRGNQRALARGAQATRRANAAANRGRA